MTANRKHILVFILLLVFLFPLRLIHLSADPPSSLSASAGEYGDPGGYSYNARNKVIFGRWILDDYNPMYISPLPHFVTYLFFLLFGVGLAQMNLVPVCFALLSFGVFFLVARRQLKSPILYTAVYLLGINYLFTLYSRIANRIMPMIFFLLLSLFFMELGAKEKKWFFLAGAAGILAYSSKGVCLYILLAFVLGFCAHLIYGDKQKNRWKKAVLFFSGLGLSSAAWFLLVYLPHNEMIKALSRINIPFLVPPKNIGKMLGNFWTRPMILFENLPILSLLAGIFFLILLYRIVHSPRRLSLLEWILAFWYVGGFTYLAIIEQRVTRHFIPQIIPMVFLSVFLLHNILQTDRFAMPEKPKKFFALLFFLWLFFPLSQPVRWLLKTLPPRFSEIWPATLILCVSSAFTVSLFYLLVKIWPQRYHLTPSPRFKKALIVLILIGAGLFSGQKYLAWALHPEFKLKTISQDLGQALDQAAIAGLWAPVICMENRHRAHESFPNYVNDRRDFLDDFRITHVFASSFFGRAELNYYWSFFKAAMAKTRLLAKYPVWNGNVYLYQLQTQTVHNPDETLLEAEVHTAPQGMPRYDPEATSRFSVQSQGKQKGFLVIAATDSLSPRDEHRIIFRIKTKPASLSPDTRLARIDIVAPDTRRVLALQDILAGDILTENGYQEFPLTFFLNRSRQLEFRIYTEGKAEIWVDHIRIGRGESSPEEK